VNTEASKRRRCHPLLLRTGPIAPLRYPTAWNPRHLPQSLTWVVPSWYREGKHCRIVSVYSTVPYRSQTFGKTVVVVIIVIVVIVQTHHHAVFCGEVSFLLAHRHRLNFLSESATTPG
jgi:hypothetical protein